jgi:hypothetical protein
MAQISADEVLRLAAQGGVVDLSGKDLSGINLFGATLKSVNFSRANLTRVQIFEDRPPPQADWDYAAAEMVMSRQHRTPSPLVILLSIDQATVRKYIGGSARVLSDL